MKKCISIILVFIFLINIESNYIVYCILKYNIRVETWHKIKEGLSEKDYCQIIVPANSKSGIIWIEKDKEFLYKFQMYDVVKVKSNKKEIIYYCVNDEKEKHLVDNYLKINNRSKELEKRLKKVPGFEFVPNKVLSFHHFPSKQLYKNQLISQYKYTYSNIPSPPPKSAIIYYFL